MSFRPPTTIDAEALHRTMLQQGENDFTFRRATIVIMKLNSIGFAQLVSQPSIPKCATASVAQTPTSTEESLSYTSNVTIPLQEFTEFVLVDEAKFSDPFLRGEIIKIRAALCPLHAVAHAFPKEESRRTIERQLTVDDFEELERATSGQETAVLVAEPFMAVVIIANTITIGLSADSPEWRMGWSLIDTCFAVCFFLEMLLKIRSTSLREHFLGAHWTWNNFDAAIVFLAIVDVFFLIAEQVASLSLSEYSNFLAILQMLRLVRLSRLVRFIKTPMFKELSLMINGLISGTRTLFWALVLLAFATYAFGVVLKQFTGIFRDDTQNSEIFMSIVDEEFSTVSRSSFTVFRCVLGDCSSRAGVPIILHLADTIGSGIYIIYAVVMVSVTLGLFNLIAGIFVENTMEAAKLNDVSMKKHRKAMEISVKKKTGDLLLKMCQLERVELSDPNAFITKERFEDALRNESIQNLLDDLGIQQTERPDLFNVLDADGNGKLNIKELVAGLARLRGEARKSDNIATRLAVTSMQTTFRSFERMCLSNQREILQMQLTLQRDRKKGHAAPLC